jgi:hypothetical protein
MTTIFLTGLSLSCDAQILTLDNLIEIHKSGLAKFNSDLLAKGWIFKGRESEASSDEGCDFPISWAFSPSQSDYSEASAFVILTHRGQACTRLISYQTSSKAAFKIIKSRIVQYKMNLINSKVVNSVDGSGSGIKEMYEGSNYTIEVITSTYTEGNAKPVQSYIFVLTPKFLTPKKD